MPEGSAIPSVATGRPSLRTALLDISIAPRERQSHIEVFQSKVRDEGSRVVRLAARRGMLKGRGRRTCELLTMTKSLCLTCVRCVKGQYAPRIEEIWAVD